MAKKQDLAKHPIRYFSEYFAWLLKRGGDEGLIKKLTVSVREGILKVTCHDEETYKKLKEYESSISLEFINLLGLKEVLLQYDVYYLVLSVVRDFERQGITEFTLSQVTSEVNKFPPLRKETFIKSILLKLAYNLSADQHYRYGLPEWFLELRGTDPVVECFGRDLFRLVPKKAPKQKKRVEKNIVARKKFPTGKERKYQAKVTDDPELLDSEDLNPLLSIWRLVKSNDPD